MNAAITGSQDQKESVGWPPARHHKVRQYIGSRRGGLNWNQKAERQVCPRNTRLGRIVSAPT